MYYVIRKHVTNDAIKCKHIIIETLFFRFFEICKYNYRQLGCLRIINPCFFRFIIRPCDVPLQQKRYIIFTFFYIYVYIMIKLTNKRLPRLMRSKTIIYLGQFKKPICFFFELFLVFLSILIFDKPPMISRIFFSIYFILDVYDVYA